MRISSFMYSIRQGIKNIKRNLLFSLASIGTIVSCLFLFGLFYCVIVNFRTAMTDLENTVTISVFFDEGVTDENITMIGQQIRLRDEVNTLDFISADEAWKQYAEEKFDDPQAAIDAFQGDNPLKNSASYKITLKDLSNQAEFVQYLKGLTGVRKVLSSEVTADGVAALNSVVSYASIGIIVILLLVSIFLISNTITIGITVRKEEIGIMKLIGATNFFVRAPFIVEGVVIGLVGSLIPLILIYYMYDTVVSAYPASSTAFMAVTVNVRLGDSTHIPCSLIAARCSPRAINVTSCPASAKNAPMLPPHPPAPIIAYFIYDLPLSICSSGFSFPLFSSVSDL